jgi:hypothetical protein
MHKCDWVAGNGFARTPLASQFLEFALGNVELDSFILVRFILSIGFSTSLSFGPKFERNSSFFLFVCIFVSIHQSYLVYFVTACKFSCSDIDLILDIRFCFLNLFECSSSGIFILLFILCNFTISIFLTFVHVCVFVFVFLIFFEFRF